MKKFIFATLFLALGVVLLTASPGYCVHKKSATVELSAHIDNCYHVAIEVVKPLAYNSEIKSVSSISFIEVKNCENLTSKSPVKPDKIPYRNCNLNVLAILNLNEPFQLNFKRLVSFKYSRPDKINDHYCSIGKRFLIVSYKN